jgi:hypothetical protein
VTGRIARSGTKGLAGSRRAPAVAPQIQLQIVTRSAELLRAGRLPLSCAHGARALPDERQQTLNGVVPLDGLARTVRRSKRRVE